MKYLRFPFLVAVLAMTGAGGPAGTEPPGALQHFKLLEPTSWLIKDERRGGPTENSPLWWQQY